MPVALGLSRDSQCCIPLPEALAIFGQMHTLPTAHSLPGERERERKKERGREATGGMETILNFFQFFQEYSKWCEEATLNVVSIFAK